MFYNHLFSAATILCCKTCQQLHPVKQYDSTDPFLYQSWKCKTMWGSPSEEEKVQRKGDC